MRSRPRDALGQIHVERFIEFIPAAKSVVSLFQGRVQLVAFVLPVEALAQASVAALKAVETNGGGVHNKLAILLVLEQGARVRRATRPSIVGMLL